MAEARDLEEVVYGPDGDQERNLYTALKDAFEVARSEETSKLRIECRTKPSGVRHSTTEWHRTCHSDDAPELVRDALYNALIDSPGEGFCGTIRFFIMEADNGKNRFGGYQRTMRPGLPLNPSDVDPSVYAGTGSLRAHYDDAVRPSMEMTLRSQDKVLHLAGIMAQTFQHLAGLGITFPEMEPSSSVPDPAQNLTATLLQGALQAATASTQQDRAAAFAQTAIEATTVAAPRQLAGPLQRHRPVPPSPQNPPRPMLDPPKDKAQHSENSPTELTMEQVEAWAAKHPDQAKALITKALMGGGHTT